MKKLALSVLLSALAVALAACELQPAPPPPPPAPAGSAQPVAAAAGSAAAGSAAAPAPRPPAPPPVDVTPECEQAAVKVADLMIAGAEDSQKPAYERDRANIVRRTEIVCTQQHWVPAALACIAQSKNDRDARACLEKFPAPTPAPAPTGSGSAAHTAHGPSGPAGSVPMTEQQVHAGSGGRIPEPHRH